MYYVCLCNDEINTELTKQANKKLKKLVLNFIFCLLVFLDIALTVHARKNESIIVSAL